MAVAPTEAPRLGATQRPESPRARPCPFYLYRVKYGQVVDDIKWDEGPLLKVISTPRRA